jgi:hypothetical protein
MFLILASSLITNQETGSNIALDISVNSDTGLAGQVGGFIFGADVQIIQN